MNLEIRKSIGEVGGWASAIFATVIAMLGVLTLLPLFFDQLKENLLAFIVTALVVLAVAFSSFVISTVTMRKNILRMLEGAINALPSLVRGADEGSVRDMHDHFKMLYDNNLEPCTSRKLMLEGSIVGFSYTLPPPLADFLLSTPERCHITII